MTEYGMSGSDSAWLMNIAMAYYSDRLRGFHMPSLKTVHFPITLKTRVWSFPSDYIRYTKIAYRMAGWNAGMIHILGLNEDIDLSQPIAKCETEITQDSPNQNLGFYLSPYGLNGTSTWVPVLYGQGGGYALNYYRPDYQNNCIRFSENLRVGDTFIEYLSSGADVNPGTLVPQAYRAAFEAFLIYRICQLRPKVRALAKDMVAVFKDDYERRLFDSNSLAKMLTENEGQDMVWRSSGFAIR
jgi:hypothetical protein